MELTSLLAKSKKIAIAFPGMEGFKVSVTYLSKESLRKIAEKSKTVVFDQKTHQPTEGLDDELYTKLYVKEALTGWEGLKLEYLRELVLLEGDVEDGELPYSEVNGYTLVTSSRAFDGWLSSVMSDISLFNKGS